jgi:tellurite resistance protein TehA-like permease
LCCNNLAQQITSTFDVVLCGLALCCLAVALVAVRFWTGVTAQPAQPPPRIFRAEDATQQLPAGAPKIYRAADDSAQHGRHEA